MLKEKRHLTLEEIDAQPTLELPDRELMSLITIAGVNVDVDVAANVCAQVLTSDTTLRCTAVA